MLINNKDISIFSAELIDRKISTENIDSLSDWLPSSITGVLLNQKYDFREIRLTFLIKEKNEDRAYKYISILSEELKHCLIQFDDVDLIFPCFLSGSVIPERLKNGKFKVTFLLKNDWGIGEAVQQTFELQTTNCKPLNIEYILHWQNTMGYYIDCFNKEEQEQIIGEKIIWVNLETLDDVIAASASWDQLLLNLGVDLQAYQPKNAQSGTTWISQVYNYGNAKTAIMNGSFKIIYMRFHKDGYPDLPESTYYPSLVWTTGGEKGNKYYIDLGIGTGWDIRDITVYVTGRYFKSVIDGNGCIIGAGDGAPFNMTFNAPDTIIETDTINAERLKYSVISSSTSSGNDLVFQTFETLAGLPLRKYGFRSSLDSSAPVKGYCDLIFNGVTLDRTPIDSVILTNNLSLLYGNQGIGNYAEASRVQVYYKGNLVLDAIPINGNLKNGFINDYDDGFYDTVNMKFLPWVNYVTGEKGPHPENVMNPDITPPSPQPQTEYIITFNANGGTLTGVSSAITVNQKLNQLPSEPTKENAIFNGWFTASTGGSKITVETVFTSNTVLYAQWLENQEPITYTVTFDPNGGTLNTSSTVTVNQNSTVNLPIPSKSGYIFNGWFTALTGGDQFTNTSIVTSDITLYAHWENTTADTDITVTVLDINGNILNNGDSVVTGTKIMLQASDAEATIKYTLDGSDPIMGITYTTNLIINTETTIRAIAEKDGKYGPAIQVAILITTYNPPVESGKILKYDQVTASSYEIQFDGLSEDFASDWDTKPPKVAMPFAAVYSIPGITGQWNYYNPKWFKSVDSGVLNDGRAYIIFDVISSVSRTGCYIQFTPDDGSEAITQNFNIDDLF